MLVRSVGLYCILCCLLVAAISATEADEPSSSIPLTSTPAPGSSTTQSVDSIIPSPLISTPHPTVSTGVSTGVSTDDVTEPTSDDSTPVTILPAANPTITLFAVTVVLMIIIAVIVVFVLAISRKYFGMVDSTSPTNVLPISIR